MTTAWISAIILGVVPFSVIAVSIRCFIPVICPDPKKCDWALTGMAVGTTLGGFIAGFFMNLAEATSWSTAGMIFAIVPVAMAIILVFVKGDHSLMVGEKNDSTDSE